MVELVSIVTSNKINTKQSIFSEEELMNSFNEIWESVKEKCRQETTDVAYRCWIEPLKAVSFDGNVFVVLAQSDLAVNIATEKYMKIFEKNFEEVIGFNVQIKFKVNPENKSDSPAASSSAENELGSNKMEFDKNYTFDTFVVGSSNQFAYSAAKSVALNPGSKQYNPLFIYGNSGLGKTHLLNAICYEIRKQKPDAKIIYTTGEAFTNEIISNIETHTMQSVHDKYRNADILLLDDVQFLAGKERTQEEFFHTFDAIKNVNGNHIILTSDRPPKEIPTLTDRLRSRFEDGLIADIQAPDIETRIAIIKKKADSLNFNIPSNVCQFIAEKVKKNIRQLEGIVKKLKAYKDIENIEPTIMSAQRAIKDVINDNQPLPITIDKVLSQVSRTYNISVDDIRSKKQKQDVVRARQTTFYILQQITDMTLEAIGKEFNKDHTTVLHSVNKISEQMANNADVNNTVSDIIKNIREN